MMWGSDTWLRWQAVQPLLQEVDRLCMLLRGLAGREGVTMPRDKDCKYGDHEECDNRHCMCACHRTDSA